MRLFLLFLVLAVGGVIGVNYYVSASAKQKDYTLAKVKRADITESVAVTGYAEPTDVWVVQSELPGGVVEKVFVNFNEDVKEGQVLAQMSSEIQRIQLEQAKFSLERAQSAVKRANSLMEGAEAGLTAALADLDAARRRFATAEESAKNKLIPESTVDNAMDQVKKAEAGVEEARSRINQARAGKVEAESQVKAAEIAVRLAEYHLEKTELKSRWNGTILNKEIREGDTVGRPQFSLNDSPSALFQIAAPLDKMQAVVKVSEADYSRVKVGQTATFRIDAYPEEVFEARVEQIRNAPTSDRTAVSYATVLSFANRKDPSTGEWMVKPRSTVTADIIIRQVQNALAAPTTAFYFSPGSGVDIPAAGPGQRVLWRIGKSSAPEPLVVNVGVSDGTLTQIETAELVEGDEVVVGRPKEAPKSSFSIPLAN